MDFQGSQLLQHPAPTVWRALMDPAVLQQCIAGCEKFEHLGGDDYSSTVKVNIGPVAARFTSKLSLSDLVEPTSCSLHFSGQGGVAGFGRGLRSQDERRLFRQAGGLPECVTCRGGKGLRGSASECGSRRIVRETINSVAVDAWRRSHFAGLGLACLAKLMFGLS